MRRLLKVFVIAALIVGAVFASAASVSPARAATAAVGRFYATCGYFSVDVAVSGINNDKNGTDLFRYQVTDATGKVLYLENAARAINTTQGSLVINMPYTTLPPTKNPIQFAVVDLDGNSNPGAFLYEVRFDAQCLSASGNTNRSGDFLPPQFLKVSFKAASAIYTAPGAGQVNNITIAAGKEYYAVYRSGDGQWVQIGIGGSDLFWVPSAVLNVDLNRLNTPPNHIDMSKPDVLQTPGIVATPFGTPIPIQGGIVATTSVYLRFRDQPSVRSTILDVIPPNFSVAVVGTNSNRSYIKVVYNGVQGWISSRFITLTGAFLNQLPIVQ